MCKDVEQHVVILEEDAKFFKLLELLGLYSERGSIIVFVDKQENADTLLKDLMKASYPCMSLHGGEHYSSGIHACVHHHYHTPLRHFISGIWVFQHIGFGRSQVVFHINRVMYCLAKIKLKSNYIRSKKKTY